MRRLIPILAVLLIGAAPRQTPIRPVVPPSAVRLQGEMRRAWENWVLQSRVRWQNFDLAVANLHTRIDSVPGIIADTIQDHWAAFTDTGNVLIPVWDSLYAHIDTLNGLGVHIHDSLDANWATWTDTVPYMGAIADTIQDHWAAFTDTGNVLIGVTDSVYAIPEMRSATIFLPHAIKDTIDYVDFFEVDEVYAPNGITISKFGLNTLDSSYTLILYKVSDVGGSATSVDTVATSSDNHAESTPNPSNQAVAANQILRVFLPSDVTDQISFFIVYTR